MSVSRVDDGDDENVGGLEYSRGKKEFLIVLDAILLPPRNAANMGTRTDTGPESDPRSELTYNGIEKRKLSFGGVDLI